MKSLPRVPVAPLLVAPLPAAPLLVAPLLVEGDMIIY